MQVKPNGLEPLYSIRDVASLWQISRDQVRRLFKGRAGMVNIANGRLRATWRIPESLVLQVASEHGYSRPVAGRNDA